MGNIDQKLINSYPIHPKTKYFKNTKYNSNHTIYERIPHKVLNMILPTCINH